MVKTICILAGQSECSRAVADPDRHISAGRGGGGADAGNPILGKRGGAVLQFFFYSFSIRKLDVLCSLHNSRFMREASLTRHFTPNARKARIAR